MMYALSVTSRPEKSSPPPVRVKPAAAENTRFAVQKWAVQVASLARRQDAEAMAASLQKSGYDAYVITHEADNKTWHRVRVGRFADLRAANQLKNTLAYSTEFKHAYVAAG
jgi:cell division septation protein DedD